MKPINELCDIVTTQHLTAGQLGQLSDEVGPGPVASRALCRVPRAEGRTRALSQPQGEEDPQAGVVSLRVGAEIRGAEIRGGPK